jgi:hypothetical protein
MNLDLIAVDFVNDPVKEAEYDRELISGARHDMYDPVCD